ncbi:MAG TPA: type II toxin-antitoxin system VapC family toxin [Acetobacteraceae bacterium]|nr:type II toxin-antitoxin system VapC family toxin [Acetobacteraceae bacterium]
MFLDASAIVAIIAGEADAASLAARLDRAGTVLTSPVAIFEAALGLARIGNVAPSAILPTLDSFLEETRAQIIPIDARVGRAAIEAFERFGKGRHPAALNLGDCFAYACAQLSGVALLCKGNDFPRTDALIA